MSLLFLRTRVFPLPDKILQSFPIFPCQINGGFFCFCFLHYRDWQDLNLHVLSNLNLN